MYQPHPSFPPPPNYQAAIWRYMGVAKLLSLLHASGLFFARSDRLGDPFEGSIPKANEPNTRAIWKELRLPDEEIQRDLARTKRFTSNFRRFVAVNCWHMNEFESAALWSLYGPRGEAVAVRSSVERLIASLTDYPEPVYIGTVGYLDYDRETVPEGNAFNPFLFKRRSYEHDRELRAIVCRFPNARPDEPYDATAFWGQETISDGVLVPVKLATLIERIYVAPTAPAWVAAALAAAVGRFDLAPSLCVSSRLDTDPFV